MEKKYLDNAVNSSLTMIRIGVANQGHKEHLDILVNDPEAAVRHAVAAHGQMEHVNVLLKDNDFGVREAAKQRKKELKRKEDKWFHYPERVIGLGVIVGSILAVLLIVSTFSTNQSFGQRCSAMGLDKGSVQWETCIQELQRKH